MPQNPGGGSDVRRMIVTTTKRHVGPDEPSGYIYVVDLERGMVLQRSQIIEAPFRERDSNPRGGLRGAKGIAVREDQIAIANPSLIFRYDPAWNLLGTITHPSCAAIHDIALQGDALWVTSSRTDALFQFDLDGRLIQHDYLRVSTRKIKGLAWDAPPSLGEGQLIEGGIDFRDPSTHRAEVYDRAHVNSVCILPQGERLVSLGQVISGRYAGWVRVKNVLIRHNVWPWMLDVNRRISAALHLRKDMHSDLIARPAKAYSAVVRFSPDGDSAVPLIVPDVTAPCHTLLPLFDGTVIYLNTNSGSVVRFDPIDGEVISTIRVTQGFLRGAAPIDEKTLVVGSGTSLLVYGLDERRVAARIRLSPEANEFTFAIAPLPAHFSLPPESFRRHLADSTGHSAEELLATGSKIA
jgi:hypothetical protein